MSELYQEVLPLRQMSREMVRELGFMQNHYTPAEMPHSHCHTLMEVEIFGALTQNELCERLRLDKSTMSRIVGQLAQQNLIEVSPDSSDQRRRLVRLSPAGKERLLRVHQDANATVQSALAQLSPEQRQQVLTGMTLYAQALSRSRRQQAFEIRPITAQDSEGVAAVIRKVMPEFGARGPGFALSDPEVDEMYSAYQQAGHRYFVVTQNGRLLGGGGIAPLAGGDGTICELRKMYFLPELRGLGIGQQLINLCLDSARELGYSQCYLETLQSMKQARALYAKNGFVQLEKALGNTGHFSCDAWYLKDL